MTGEQLQLFYIRKTETEELSDDFEGIVVKVDNFRKSFFKKMSSLSSEVRTLQARVDILEAQLYILRAFIEEHMSKEKIFNINGVKITEEVTE